MEGLRLSRKLSRAPARFDEAELKALNARLLHGLPYEAVRQRLAALGARATARRSGLRCAATSTMLADAQVWQHVVPGRSTPVIADDDRDFLDRGARAAAAGAMG